MNVLFKREIESAPDPEAARRQKILEYAEHFSGPFEALQKQYAQAVIRPAETRRRLIQALRILAGKREEPLPRKHGVMPV